MKKWQVKIGGRILAVSAKTLIDMAKKGEINADTQVRMEDGKNFVRASSVKGLVFQTASNEPAPPPPAAKRSVRAIGSQEPAPPPPSAKRPARTVTSPSRSSAPAPPPPMVSAPPPPLVAAPPPFPASTAPRSNGGGLGCLLLLAVPVLLLLFIIILAIATSENTYVPPVPEDEARRLSELSRLEDERQQLSQELGNVFSKFAYHVRPEDISAVKTNAYGRGFAVGSKENDDFEMLISLAKGKLSDQFNLRPLNVDDFNERIPRAIETFGKAIEVIASKPTIQTLDNRDAVSSPDINFKITNETIAGYRGTLKTIEQRYREFQQKK